MEFFKIYRKIITNSRRCTTFAIFGSLPSQKMKELLFRKLLYYRWTFAYCVATLLA
jgi:hypothetical protein